MMNQKLIKKIAFTIRTDIAKSLKTKRASINRLLDEKSDSVTLNTLKKAAKFLNKKLVIKLI